jgi:hypothetical protein
MNGTFNGVSLRLFGRVLGCSQRFCGWHPRLCGCRTMSRPQFRNQDLWCLSSSSSPNLRPGPQLRRPSPFSFRLSPHSRGDFPYRIKLSTVHRRTTPQKFLGIGARKATFNKLSMKRIFAYFFEASELVEVLWNIGVGGIELEPMTFRV